MAGVVKSSSPTYMRQMAKCAKASLSLIMSRSITALREILSKQPSDGRAITEELAQSQTLSFTEAWDGLPRYISRMVSF